MSNEVSRDEKKSTETLFQTKFIINDFFIPSKLPVDSFWVKENEILLKPHDKGVMAYVIEKVNDPTHKIIGIDAEEKLLEYVQICSLVTGRTPTLDGGSGNSIRSIDELGDDSEMLRVVPLGLRLTEEQKQHITPHFKKFLEESKRLYDKYSALREKFVFLETALKYYYKSQAKRDWETSGNFLDATIALEALLNDGALDLKYKIAARASFILNCTGLPAYQDITEVFESVRKYYDMRSDVVHGGSGEPDFKAFQNLVCFVRWTLICFYVLCHNRRNKEPFKVSSQAMKRNLIKELDYALLDEEKRILFKKEIIESIKDFRPDIPRSFEKPGKWRISW